MYRYKYCNKLPYTVSIQIPSGHLERINSLLKKYGLENHVGGHISLKYLGYEEHLTDEKLMDIVNALRSCFLGFEKQDLRVAGFGIMQGCNAFFNDLLYVKIEPYYYLKSIHETIISCLEDKTDLFEMHDLDHYTPHISSGAIERHNIIDMLNDDYRQMDSIIIDDWSIVVHTSREEYRIR